MSKEIIEGNKKTRWKDREPYAYWKGNPKVAEKRKELVKCNVSDQEDWNARIYIKVPCFYYLQILDCHCNLMIRSRMSRTFR